MGVNKVIFGDETLVDLTGDTVTPDTLVKGVTAHDKSGEKITGKFEGEDVTAETADYTAKLNAQDTLLNDIMDALSKKFARPSTLQNKTVTPSESSQIVTADSGYDGLGTVTVNAIPSEYLIPELQSKTVTPSTSVQNVVADSGYDGLSKVIVNAIPQSILDAEYQRGFDEAIESMKPYKTELAWIQSSGAQYINTDFIPNNNTRVVIDFMFISGLAVFGSYAGYSSYALQQSGGKWYTYYGSSQGSSAVSTTSERCVVDMNKNVTTINGQSLRTAGANTFTCAFPMVLFALYDSGNITYWSSTRIYSCKVYDNGTLIRDYIPVLDKSNVPCLYDKVGNQLYYNKGTGTFTYA